MCIIGSNVYKNANEDKPKGELSTWSMVITSTSESKRIRLEAASLKYS